MIISSKFIFTLLTLSRLVSEYSFLDGNGSGYYYNGDDYNWDYSDFGLNTEYTEKIAANMISTYIYPVVLLAGTVGNVLSFIIMFRIS